MDGILTREEEGLAESWGKSVGVGYSDVDRGVCEKANWINLIYSFIHNFNIWYTSHFSP